MPIVRQALTLAICVLLLAGVESLIRPGVTAAQTSSATFTVSPTGNSTGVVIVDQSTGAITYCTSLVNISGINAIPSGFCTMLARATPGPSPNSLSVSASSSSIFVINNQTGQILQCATIDNVVSGVGHPAGTCVQQGTAFK